MPRYAVIARRKDDSVEVFGGRSLEEITVGLFTSAENAINYIHAPRNLAYALCREYITAEIVEVLGNECSEPLAVFDLKQITTWVRRS
ncbi:hypothetical protein KY316_03485 [Candidatus Woesearchaeota archaeon]|nr:hypothetical protein [Candidatus Woesearchaeota archaeon]